MNSALPLCHEVSTDTRALLTWQQSWAPALQPAKADGEESRASIKGCVLILILKFSCIPDTATLW